MFTALHPDAMFVSLLPDALFVARHLDAGSRLGIFDVSDYLLAVCQGGLCLLMSYIILDPVAPWAMLALACLSSVALPGYVPSGGVGSGLSILRWVV